MLDYRQPETRATQLPRAGSVNPIKALKQAFPVMRWYSISCVLHEDSTTRTVLTFYRDRAGFPVELDCVIDEVGQHLLESTRIGKNGCFGSDFVINRNRARRSLCSQ
jgi:hypothetical protein